jgi:adenine-specific DNA-methyltransferase
MPILDWLNKDKAVTTAQQVPYRLLQPVAELSVGDADSGNMLIQGDNLEALKSLLPLYAGKVKCIYIDPPYNTRSAFEHYDDNLEHSVWLSMMYPRLELLRELLSEDGSIWVSIDDNEAHYLKVVMDEVFGRSNFIVDISWHKRVSPANDTKYFSNDHDHIFVYTKQKTSWSPNRVKDNPSQLKYYNNPDNDPRGLWNSTAYTCAKSINERPNLYYSITNPNTGLEIFPKKTRVWAFNKKTHLSNVSNGLVYWGKNGDAKTPRFKKFLAVSKGVVPRSIWNFDETGHNQQSNQEAEMLFGEALFSTPKPERLVQKILKVATETGDLVLDSFLGSGTTAAVAHKMNRRYIGIEMGDHAVTHCQPRLRKVVEGEQGGISKSVEWQGGGGVNFFRLGEPVFDEYGHIREGVSFSAFAQYLWFLETGTPLTKKPSTPFLGEHNGKGYYLLYNGILGDRRPQGGNVLTSPILAGLPTFDGPKIIFGESSRLGDARLEREEISFRQIPYEVTSK